MKLFIANEYKMKSYKLPEKIEESFMISYISEIDKEEKIIYIQAENNKWTLQSNSNISLYYNNMPQNHIELAEYKTFCICFNDCEEYVFLFCMPSIIEKFLDYEVPLTLNQMLIGSSNNNHITYSNALVSEQHVLIERDNSGSWWIRVAENSPAIYVNQVLATYQKINYGDEIFIFGLKVIWMKGFIRINEISNKVKINSLSSYNLRKDDNTKYTPITSKQKNINLYKENEYFFHTPSLKPVIEKEVIELEQPPKKELGTQTPFLITAGASLIMGIASLVTGLVSIVNIVSGKSTIFNELVSLVMCVAMLVGTVVFPIITRAYDNKRRSKQEERRITKYGEYLESKKQAISNAINKQAQALREIFASTDQCAQIIENHNSTLWSREIKDKEFLTLRLGIGTKEADIEIDSEKLKFTLEEDVLRDKMAELIDAKLTMTNVPITASLLENNNILALILNCHNKKSYIDGIMIQLMAYYSSSDLKIVFLVNEKNDYIWDTYKFLSHCISKNKDKRFFAYSDEEAKDVSTFLESIYQERINEIKNPKDSNSDIKIDKPEEYYKAFDSYYLIITDDIVRTKNVDIIEKLLRSNANYGFSILIFEQAIKNLPSKCNQFVNISDHEAGLLSKEVTSRSQLIFTPEFSSITDPSPLVSKVSNIPVSVEDAISTLPQTLEFLEMYKVGKIEQLNISSRWQTNDPTLSLNTPVGVHPNGNLFELNLHEKEHGPHGLIAGSTGSGKSEFILTYILSMCINYSPYEVQFVLIDYKGGGLAGAFENREKGTKIPHLVGTITNLDTSEMNRTLVSIRSELKRRQQLFNDVRDSLGESTIDIYKYQKYYREGQIKEPIAHLFIISDEFAELKAQQPDFMDELVSTARIGRSLGVHLILSTQKPSGVVDDQIWSNAKFKVCLKVQSESDSQEMLKRPDAATIKETGRFYLQIGYDEVFEIGQSAWSGAKYIPTDIIEKKIDDSINFINNSGDTIKKINNIIKKEEQFSKGEQLTNIVKYLTSLAIKEKIRIKQLWLPSIPNEIYLGNTIKKYNFKPAKYEFISIIGEYDDPENQRQGLLTVDIAESGNIIIYGVTGSGKENQVVTMLYSLCSYHYPQELNIYIMDFGAEVLKVFSKMPHVGDYVTSYDNDKVNNLLNLIEREFNKRKEILSEFGGSFSTYNSKCEEKLPLMLIVINNYESFYESYNGLEDSFNRLFRESSKFGIIFLVTASATNALTTRVSQNFATIYGLRFNDEYEFRYLLDAPAGLVPKKVFGRGLTKVNGKPVEYQTAYITVFDSINETIKQNAISLTNYYKVKVKPIPSIPSEVSSKSLRKYVDNLTNVPIGINVKDYEIATYDFKTPRITSIIGNDIQYSSEFLSDFYKMLTELPNTILLMLDTFMTIDIPQKITSTTDAVEFIPVIYDVMNKPDQPSEHRVVIINGISDILDDITLADELKNTLRYLLANASRYPNTSFILIDEYQRYRNLTVDGWYQSNPDLTGGIWIGEGIENQIVYPIQEIENNENQIPNNIGYIVNKGKYQLIKTIASEE